MTLPPGTARFAATAVPGLGDVRAGDDLADLLAEAMGAVGLPADGDVLVVTSKVVAKAEGRVVRMDRAAAVRSETDRVVATRGETRIVRNRLGLVLAAAGVDASNTPAGTVVLLPLDPDASARALRERLSGRTGRNLAVVVSDTAGRAWRQGQTDIAVGAAGLEPLHDLAGRTDHHGNPLAVTAPAVADALAAAGDLVKGKLARTPLAVLSGLGHLVLPPGDHGPGARALVRAEESDMFGLGAREAVLAAVRRRDDVGGADLRGFGPPVSAEELAWLLEPVLAGRGLVLPEDGAVRVVLGAAGDFARGVQAADVLATAYAVSWRAADASAESVLLRPAGP